MCDKYYIHKKTKIVSTLGPSTDDKETLRKMMHAGVNTFRINFSHAKHEDAAARIQSIRQLNEEENLAVGILADLQGPKLRIGQVVEGAKVEKGDVLCFTHENIVGDATRVFMTYERFAQDVKEGERILVDDGKLIFKVIETNGKDTVKAEVIQGGPLKSNKGVNLPNTHISLPALTPKDIEDAKFAIAQHVDWIALSFVRHAQDVLDLKKLIQEHGDHKISIIAKIEKPEALENIDEIIAECDGIMVARGDLGVEIPMEKVPIAQKNLVEKAKRAQKPVVIATQMMESMIESMTPTRAEVNDVANSVMDGADAVMLSGETSVGKYPVEVIQTMANILMSVEDDAHIRTDSPQPEESHERFITDMICYKAAEMSESINTQAIVTLTYSGYTAYQISSHRPKSHIFVFTPNRRIINALSLLWGVYAFYYDEEKSTDETVIDVNRFLRSKGYLKTGDSVVNLNAMPVFRKGMTNTLRFTTLS